MRVSPHDFFQSAFYRALAAACMVATPAAWAAPGSAGIVDVGLVQPADGSVQLRLRTSESIEPVLHWTGVALPAPYLLTLTWQGATVTLAQPLPQLPREGMGPVRSLTWQSSGGETRLQLQLSAAVTPRLRQVGNTWVLQLDLAPPAPPVASSVAPPAAQAAAVKQAPPTPPHKRSDNPRQQETLLVEVEVNGEALPGIVQVERMADGRLVMPASAWRAARLRAAGDAVTPAGNEPGYSLDAVPGLAYRIDRGQLKLLVTAPTGAFDASSVKMTDAPLVPPNAAAPGAYVNYDFSGVRDAGGSSYGGLLEGVAFNRWGALSSGMAVVGDGTGHHAVRTETYFRRDMPAGMEALVIGDTIGSGGAWSRPVRYGGVRYSRDFSLAPGYVVTPMPTISGSAALPSTVDVLVNSQKQSTSNLPIGPFALTNVPVVNGAGEVNVVVRDLRGVETVISQSYYASPSLLAAGLSDFSIEAGSLRENFGTVSNGYGPVFAAGTYRYGFTPAITGGARVELQRTRQAAGVDATALLGTFAVVRGAAALSRTSDSDPSGGASGTRWLAAVERVTPSGGGSAQLEHFSSGFRPFAAVAQETRPRDRLQVGGGMPLGAGVNAGASYTWQTTWDGDRFALAAVNLGVKLPANIYLSAYASMQVGATRGWSAGLNLLMPLESHIALSSSTRRNTDGTTATSVQATRASPQGPGWGWSVAASDVPGQLARAKALINTNSGQLSAEANAAKNGNAVRLGANGSIGWLEGLAFASRRIDQGAFAVVSVGDLAGVAVSRSNQVAATTNSHGLALVTGLLPYEKNQLTINAEDLPMDVDVSGTREVLVPYARSGVVVKFPVKRSRNALVVLHRPDGTDVPAGARVRVTPGGHEFVVARRGEVYLMDVQMENQIEVRFKEGDCALRVVLPDASGAEARIGPLTCAAATP